MNNETAQAFLDWAHAITAAIQNLDPDDAEVLGRAMRRLHDAVQTQQLNDEP